VENVCRPTCSYIAAGFVVRHWLPGPYLRGRGSTASNPPKGNLSVCHAGEPCLNGSRYQNTFHTVRYIEGCFQVIAHHCSNFRLRQGDPTLTPSLGVMACECPDELAAPETRILVLPDSESRMIISSFLWTKHQNVTDRRTDRRICYG